MFFKTRYRIRRDNHSGKWVPERKTTFLCFSTGWSAYSYAMLESDPFEFDTIEEALKCLEHETGKSRNRLNIQYVGL